MPEHITVSVGDDHVDHIDEVVERLRAAGMHVDQVLRPVGVITGSVETPAAEALGQLAGVVAVERQRTVRLPPPDAGVQ
ncbi:hypothetical protein [Pseudonocardia nigra]|uniref:hypothetical protein n=1 Tax=Pseudonocardia nigra TaxID=1921578 RepID=UPI001FE8B863|nr:hypothetical protein [Pseudonocardia nigra]